MGEKSDLQDRAEELGLEFRDSDTISDLKEMISDHEAAQEAQERAAAQAAREKDLIPVEQLEANSRSLFGVPRSVFVGAKSAGLISGDRLTKDEAAEAIQKFLSYTGGN